MGIMSKGDTIDMTIIFAGFILSMIGTSIFPVGSAFSYITMFAGVGLVGLGTAGMQLILFVIACRYPYFEITVDGEDDFEILDVYLSPNAVVKTEPTKIKGLNVATLNCNFDVASRMDNFETRQIKVIFAGIWEDRVKTGSGKAFYFGHVIDHPNSGRIIVHRYAYTKSDIYKDMIIPVYVLAYACRGDVNKPITLHTTLKAMQVLFKDNFEAFSQRSLEKVLSVMKGYQAMEIKLAATEHQLDHYRSTDLEKDREIRAQKSQTTAILNAQGTQEEMAAEIQMDWATNEKDLIKCANRYARPPSKVPSFLTNKYFLILITFTILGGIFYAIVSQPGFLQQLAEVQIFIVSLLIFGTIIAVIIFWITRKQKAPK
jgi:hypothetical protein